MLRNKTTSKKRTLSNIHTLKKSNYNTNFFSPDGPGGRFCGYKSGFATISRVPKDKDLKLSVVVQVKKSYICLQFSWFTFYSVVCLPFYYYIIRGRHTVGI